MRRGFDLGLGGQVGGRAGENIRGRVNLGLLNVASFCGNFCNFSVCYFDRQKILKTDNIISTFLVYFFSTDRIINFSVGR